MYVCIDLKSFYASVECVARGLDPFTTNLVVADPDRTQTTICLAITPAMKELGIRNRCRVFEIPPHVSYIKAKPRMKLYMQVSAQIYKIYLRYISPDDIHVYSIDECFINVDPYLDLYHTNEFKFAEFLMDKVLEETGICATAGVGTNLFLAKVALDITAKHSPSHIGFLDEERFKKEIWHHRPITDIWNVGPGIARRLEKYGVMDLHGVTRLNPDTLYKEFGVNALYLIDHAHGKEPCTIKDIHNYKPQSSSLASGQVLPCAYTYEEGLTVLKEMVDALVLKIIKQNQVACRISLAVGYDIAQLKLVYPDLFIDEEVFVGQHGKQPYKRSANTFTGGSKKLVQRTDSLRTLSTLFCELYEQHVDKQLMIRRINITLSDLAPKEFEQLSLFESLEESKQEAKLQKAVIQVKERFGKNAVLKGISYTEKATARERNQQVGGHHA